MRLGDPVGRPLWSRVRGNQGPAEAVASHLPLSLERGKGGGDLLEGIAARQCEHAGSRSRFMGECSSEHLLNGWWT